MTFWSIKPLCHPECVRYWLRFSSEHPLCHEALKQTLMVQTITRAFPDMCVYTSDWLQFSMACPTRVSLKGSGCVCVCVLASSWWHHHMHSPCRLLSQTLSCLFTMAEFLPKGKGTLGGGAQWELTAGVKVDQIRYTKSGNALKPSTDDGTRR